MEDILKKIEQASNGDWKKQMWMQNCVNWVIDNFDDIEPHIKRLWLDKEKKQIISSTGTGKCKNAFNGTGKCEDKER